MEAYFPLSSVFATQHDPTFCGLASLSMTLNALAVDPGRHWKGVWRWFSDEMLDCCLPLDLVKEKGTTIDQVACLAVCNGAKVEVNRTPKAGLTEFREAVKRSTSAKGNDQTVVIASYSRPVLNQTGAGHFSPLGGYVESEDMVLIMDVARFKLPPHWVPLEALWNAMNTQDPDTEKHRGFMIVQRDPQQTLPVTVTLGPDAMKAWTRIRDFMFVELPDKLMGSKSFSQALSTAIVSMPPVIVSSLVSYQSLLGNSNMTVEHKKAIASVLDEICNMQSHGKICAVFSALKFNKTSGKYEKRDENSPPSPKPCSGCETDEVLCICGFTEQDLLVLLFLLAWPNAYWKKLDPSIKEEFKEMTNSVQGPLRDEIGALTKQIMQIVSGGWSTNHCGCFDDEDGNHDRTLSKAEAEG